MDDITRYIFKNKLLETQAWKFRNDWMAQCGECGMEKAWICIDGSNSDCGAEENTLAEKGKAKSHGMRDVVSYMWAVNANDGTSVTYNVYCGDRVDSKALREMVAFLKANGIAASGIILDKCFCNRESLKLLSDKVIPYVVMLKRNARSPNSLVEKFHLFLLLK